jgi:hypothetical protein
VNHGTKIRLQLVLIWRAYSWSVLQPKKTWFGRGVISISVIGSSPMPNCLQFHCLRIETVVVMWETWELSVRR